MRRVFGEDGDAFAFLRPPGGVGEDHPLGDPPESRPDGIQPDRERLRGMETVFSGRVAR